MTPSLSRKDRTSSPPLPSHNIKPGRRRLWRWRPRNWTLAQALPLALLAMLAMSVLATALPVDETERLGSSAAGTDERLLRRATTRGRGILVDPRADARVRDRHADHPRSDDPYLDLRARDGDGDDAGSQSTTERIASRFTSATVTATPSAAATSSLLVESDPSAATELPAPFDTNLGNNFTSPSCPQFFDTFLNDAAFKGCLPLSLLLLVRFRSTFHHFSLSSPEQDTPRLTTIHRTPKPSSPCKRTPNLSPASLPPPATSSRPIAKT